MAGSELIDVSSLTALATDALCRAGVAHDDARVSGRILVEADMMGLGTHGVVRLPDYVNRLRLGGIDARAAVHIDRRGASVAIADGGNGLGTVVGTRALAAALEMVEASGIAYVGCRNSNHFGALAPYALQACEAGYVLIAGSNASTTMAPWGGKDKRIGNNPLCVAAPCADGTHFILDMAMSVAARGKIRAAQAAGAPIPPGWAVDRDGIATVDPGEALAGILLPIGAHKGSGLSMAVDILSGVLTGAGFLTGISSWSERPAEPSNLGHFFLLLDPARLVGRDTYASAMSRFQAIVLSTPPADPAQPVLLPGQLEQTRRRAALESGVAVRADLLASLRDLAGGLT
ncbi:MAG: Ldh family oxidoreductase [Gammaproteobacteria bacterium]|nr:Ldh family oxidoreductase [Gammaproteobacteria bacterium]NIM73171.1 Ldh family oxidoreductase [Gammaproteobacteria bacterium]NIN40007.1 Ldh family oxidoreductase [Gammaproteobacteria bacterium]NIO26221.1 Ldh family oxidoreductase [Gammaproteobacteria bacterium]NIO66030.1 Ldh family oxidoreductase [Gammaproteobacteria bacterium]